MVIYGKYLSNFPINQHFWQDEKNQVLTTNVWFDHEWHDELLKWDPEKFGGIDMLRIPCDKIWLPDIVLYNRFGARQETTEKSLREAQPGIL